MIMALLMAQPLLNPLFTSAMLLPVLPGTVQRAGRVSHILHPLIADFGQPEFYRFSLGAGNRLDQTKQHFWTGDVGQSHFPVFGR